MRRVVVGIALAGLTSMSLSAALKEGQKAPEFSAKASLDGKEIEFSLADALKKGPVVVYFYPSAFTGGCNIEAHTFAVNKEKFDAAGATIIGVSRDSVFGRPGILRWQNRRRIGWRWGDRRLI
jgi:thioredoxin-dependent peroxiredoxin